MSKMKWSYKTVHFELKREGLLGGSFLDEAEIEEQLNDFGRSGWELISVLEVQDGIITFFKQSLNLGIPSQAMADIEAGSDNFQKAEGGYEVDEVRRFDVYEGDEVPETSDVYEDEFPQASDQSSAEFEPSEHYHNLLEEEELSDQEDGTNSTSVRQDDYDEIVEEAQVEPEDQEGSEEQQDNQSKRGIGAIRIE